MDIQTVINSTLILMGAGIMLFGMVRSGDIQEMMPFVPENRQETIRIYFLIHRSLMMFFLVGYIASIAAIFMRYPLLSETFVSLIFLFGGIFVYIGIVVQSRLMSAVRQTFEGILPICTRCREIRISDNDSGEGGEWRRIESHIAEKVDAGLSFMCPECSEKPGSG